MTISGKIHKKFDEEVKSEKFTKREFIVEYAENPMYPQFVKFQLVNKKCEILDKFDVGDSVEIHFNLRGNAWHPKEGGTKYFNTLEAWKIDLREKGEAKPEPKPKKEPVLESSIDDLPF